MPPTGGIAVASDPGVGDTQSSTPSSPVRPTMQSRSYLKVAQRQEKSLKKYDVEITMKDGISSVVVPEEIFVDPSPLWEDFLIGKFLDKTPHIGKVHAIVNKIWTLGDKSQMIEVYEMNSTTMKFRITDQATRNRVFRRGMWNLAGVPVVMTQWKPFVEEEKTEESIPLWVHLRNVPLNMFSWKGLSFVTSPVGVPVRLHPDTAQCKDLEVAKVFVNVDLTKELPKTMNFSFQGKDTLIEFTYSRLPAKCTACGKWGHLSLACLRKPVVMSEQVREEQSSDNIKEVEETQTSKEEVEIQKPATDAAIDAAFDTVSGDGDATVTAVSEATDTICTEKEACPNENEWITPTKVGKTLEKNEEQNLGPVSLLAKSPFAALALEEEEGKIFQLEKWDL
ncbi:hypothetical protein Bca4012_087294 [Brassica carinata]